MSPRQRVVMRWLPPLAALSAACGFAVSGCRPGPEVVSESGLVVTQVPVRPGVSGGLGSGAVEPGAGADALEALYPAGSRLVWVPNPTEPGRGVVVLSGDLAAAGGAVVGPDGRQVLFVGRETATSPWQVHRVVLGSGAGARPPRPERVTGMPGGAMTPAWLPGGRFVFASPVAGGKAGAPVPALYSQSLTGGPPARLTHGVAAAVDPTVLADGRILFVSSVPGTAPASGLAGSATSLFTINNDGTEMTAYAGQHDPPAALRRPRETDDGRIVFLSVGPAGTGVGGRIEQVLTARPFRSRSVALPSMTSECRSVEVDREGVLVVSGVSRGADRGRTTYAIHRVAPGSEGLGAPLFDDPAWDDVEAVLPARAGRAMGRLSNVDPGRRDGVVLCLDVRQADPALPAETAGGGHRVRVCRGGAEPGAGVLGEVPVEADGSFLVRVPADVALSLELVDGAGRVVRRCPPAWWVRPGENRACVGCHEPHNRAPENVRPRAVRKPPVELTATGAGGDGRSPGVAVAGAVGGVR